ncbi:MAG: 50S ribosomal protein L4 [Spirochaetes bacterium]|nr:50S ribosomal protein L4 [Spirochaetota bacterium]
MQVKVIGENGAETSTLDVADALINSKVNMSSLYEAIKNERANKRQGTSRTKSMAEVSGGGKRPWRQKGTGHARVGSSRSPLWTGGGHIHAIRPRDYHYEVPRKVKRLALMSVFSLKHGENSLRIVDDLSVEKPQTKRLAAFIKKIGKEGSRVAFIVGKTPETMKSYTNLILSLRNIRKLDVVNADSVAIHPLYYADEIFVTKSAMKKLSDRVQANAKAE